MELSITAKPRVVLGKQTNQLRKTGKLPAVLYGQKKDTVPLEVERREFERVFRQAGENTLVNLKIEGNGERKVLIYDVAHHVMKNQIIHVDFYEVDLTRKIHAKIPLHFVGTASAVKELGGILVKNLTEVEVEALPADLPQFIEVDISGLKTFHDMVRLGELKISSQVKILGHAEEVIATTQPPRTEEELAELEKPAAEAEKAAIEGMESAMAEAKAKEEKAAEKGEKAEESAPEAAKAKE